LDFFRYAILAASHAAISMVAEPEAYGLEARFEIVSELLTIQTLPKIDADGISRTEAGT
jgi:hypothetical protein